MFKGPRTPGVAPAKPRIELVLTDQDYLELARLAERDGVGMATYVRTLFRRHLEAVNA